MKLLLINPVMDNENGTAAIPLNLLYLSKGVRTFTNGIDVTIADLNLEIHSDKRQNANILKKQYKLVAELCKTHGPFQLVGIAGYCASYPITMALAEFIKRHHKARIVLGGPHATFLAKDLLRKYSFVDFVIRHDGAYPLAMLCDALRGSKSLKEVPALTYRRPQSASIAETPADVDMPSMISLTPDYTELPLRRYAKTFPELRIRVLAGTGCPCSCKFCVCSLMWHKRYRTGKPALIADAVRKLKKYFPSDATYSLVHDNLLASKTYTEKLCSAMKPLKIKWACSGRADLLHGNPGLISRMAKSGCCSIFIGMESGSERIQQVIGKRLKVDTIIPLVRELSSKGIRPSVSFMVGFPQETDADRNKTLRLAVKLNCLDVVAVPLFFLTPYPGAKFSRGELRFLRPQDREPSYFRMSARLERLARRDKNIFSTCWRLKDSPKNTPLSPAATSRLYGTCIRHPQAFDYLFSTCGVRPTDLFALFRTSVSREKLLTAVRTLLPDEHRYKPFLRFLKLSDAVLKLKRAADAQTA